MSAPADLSFKQLLELLEKEHERCIHDLGNENLRIRGGLGDIRKDCVEKTERGEKNLAADHGALTVEEEMGAPAVDALSREANANKVVVEDCCQAGKDVGNGSNVRVDQAFCLNTTWTNDKHVSNSMPDIFLDILSSASNKKITKLRRQLTDLSKGLPRVPRKWQDIVMHPTSPKLLSWVCVGLVFLTYDFIWTPVFLAFEPPDAKAIEVFDILICLYWIFDILVNFMTATWSSNGKLLKEFRPIAHNYLSGFFFFDLFIVVSDAAVLIMESIPKGINLLRGGKFFRFMRLARSLRLLRLLKVQDVLSMLLERIDAEACLISVDITFKVLLVLASNHILACAWFAVGKTSGGWVQASEPFNDGIWEQYLLSLHWTLSAFTPAQKPLIRPNTIPERVFAMSMILLAIVGMSTFLGSISSQMIRLRQLKGVYISKIFTLRKFFRQNRISAELASRLTRYVHIAEDIHEKRLPRSKVELLKYLSGPLNIELQTEIYSPSLKCHPFFEIYANSHAMNQLCFAAVGKEYYSKGDLIFSCGADSAHMEFLHSGTLFYLRPKGLRWDTSHPNNKANKTRVIVVTTGQWFCEASLWGSWVHRGTMVSLLESEVIKLNSSKFRQITEENRDIFERSRTWANEFLMMLQDTCRLHGCVWDLPPETILSEIYHDNSQYSENDPRLLRKRLQHAELRKAEIYQAQLDRTMMDSDSSDDEEARNINNETITNLESV